MIMKRILIPILSVAMLLATSCGPSRHAIHVEMRYPSKSGIDLAGKNLSVVYLENNDESANMFNEGIADAFAYALETDYGTGEGSVGIYRMRCEGGVEYASRDSLLSLLIDTDADVVFLLDTLKLGPVYNDGSTQFTMALHCFDAMDKSEKVHTFNGTSSAVLNEGGARTGSQVAASFKSQWRNEQYSLMYFGNEQWYKSLDRAEAYDWKGAIDIWMTFLSSSDPLRRSCAAYNIATACYMLGDYELAVEWLDMSEKESTLVHSETLRKRINERRKS